MRFCLCMIRGFLCVGDYVLHSFTTDFSPQTMKIVYVYIASDCFNPGELHWNIISNDYFGCFYPVIKFYYIISFLISNCRCCSSLNLLPIMMVTKEQKYYINMAWLPVWQYIFSTWGKYSYLRRSRG